MLAVYFHYGYSDNVGPVADALSTQNPFCNGLSKCRQVHAKEPSKVRILLQQSCARHSTISTQSLFLCLYFAFINNPRSFANLLASRKYNKLYRQAPGLYHNLAVQASYVAVDKYGVQNRISVDLVTHAPAACSERRLAQIPLTVRQATNVKLYIGKSAKSTPNKANDTDDYVIAKSIFQIGQGREGI